MYKLFNDRNNVLCSIIRLQDNASIPLNPDNTDYQDYLKWVAEGNTPLPAESN